MCGIVGLFAKDPGVAARLGLHVSGMLAEMEAVKTILNRNTFYAPVTNEEKAAIYTAMASEFSGTGHGHYCEQGHPFTVGECGMPMQTSVCPQCGSPVGGLKHENVNES